ncbi:Uncharacterised protein [Pantoea agglomerans]|uniref:Uncharacterized protein n=1 Tax=Enterobacter agglomerans TaxID=549 RepID=A0A379LRD4_ENTAG|nr:Uncharacterised protein [Pantoea agglomerans]
MKWPPGTRHQIAGKARVQQPDRTGELYVGCVQDHHFAPHGAQGGLPIGGVDATAVDDFAAGFSTVKGDASLLQFVAQLLQGAARIEMRLCGEKQAAGKAVFQRGFDVTGRDPLMLLRHAGEARQFTAVTRRSNHQRALLFHAINAFRPPAGRVLAPFDHLWRCAFCFTPGARACRPPSARPHGSQAG